MSLFAEELHKTNSKAVSPKNRVELLLEELDANEPENAASLREALEDFKVSNAAITRTIKRIWGEDTVKETSVRSYRAQNGLI